MAAGTSGRRRGFQRASAFLDRPLRAVSEARGFAVSRLLTRWPEIVGEETARIATPVRVSYAQGGFGATLTLLTSGAHAPFVQAELPRIRERVNACYGYNAISRIRITQTHAGGFAEAAESFASPLTPALAPPDPRAGQRARDLAGAVSDARLRAALEALGRNVLSRSRRAAEKHPGKA
ncbi:MAG: DUF721 domain-containing protein [Alphaproteobacteria bacterium]|nr:MAG: DUF721 domain-containing protein [Alphaproteobacteria bacterium]